MLFYTSLSVANIALSFDHHFSIQIDHLNRKSTFLLSIFYIAKPYRSAVNTDGYDVYFTFLLKRLQINSTNFFKSSLIQIHNIKNLISILCKNKCIIFDIAHELH